MSIISLYNRELVTFPMHHQIASNGQNQSTTIDRYIVFCIGRGFPQRLFSLFSYALSCRTPEIERSFKPRDWVANGDVTYISQFMDESFRTIWDYRIAYLSGTWSPPIMDWSDEAAVRKVIEEDRQSVSKARENWQNATGEEANDWTFKRFLSALVQDISE